MSIDPTILNTVEIKLLAGVLKSLNNEKRPQINNCTLEKGGGKDGIPVYEILEERENKNLMIWIRGTRLTNVNDVGISLKCKPVEFLNGAAHKGYLKAGQYIAKRAMAFIEGNEYRKIYTFGHSLGAATASVVGVILRKIHHLENVRGLLFASPPVFDAKIAKGTRKYMVSFIKSTDIVPKLAEGFKTLARLKNYVAFTKRGILVKMPKLCKMIGREKDIEVLDFNTIKFPAEICGKPIVINNGRAPVFENIDFNRPDTYNASILNAAVFNHPYDENYCKPVVQFVESIERGEPPKVIESGTDMSLLEGLFRINGFILEEILLLFYKVVTYPLKLVVKLVSIFD